MDVKEDPALSPKSMVLSPSLVEKISFEIRPRSVQESGAFFFFSWQQLLPDLTKTTLDSQLNFRHVFPFGKSM